MAIKPNELAVCTSCGAAGPAKRRGSGGIELILWLCWLLPGIIYSIWRSNRGECGQCGSLAIISVNAPMVTTIADGSAASGQAIRHSIADARKNEARQNDRDAYIYKFLGYVVSVLAFIGIAPAVAGPENTDTVLLIGLISVASLLIYRKTRRH